MIRIPTPQLAEDGNVASDTCFIWTLPISLHPSQKSQLFGRYFR